MSWRKSDEAGRAVKNQAMQGLGNVRFYIQVQWEATEGFVIKETHNYLANGWGPGGTGGAGSETS